MIDLDSMSLVHFGSWFTMVHHASPVGHPDGVPFVQIVQLVTVQIHATEGWGHPGGCISYRLRHLVQCRAMPCNAVQPSATNVTRLHPCFTMYQYHVVYMQHYVTLGAMQQTISTSCNFDKWKNGNGITAVGSRSAVEWMPKDENMVWRVCMQ